VDIIRQPVGERMVLGRGPDSAVPLDAPGISREHLEVRAEDSAVFLTDLSSNGTWLNGSRMPPRRKCKVGEDDYVELPGYELRLQLARSAPLVSSNGGRAEIQAPGSAAPLQPSATSRTGSLGRSFTGLELFVFVVALASAVLLAVYLAS
jgi:predicted component of type VI protein secretion system